MARSTALFGPSLAAGGRAIRPPCAAAPPPGRLPARGARGAGVRDAPITSSGLPNQESARPTEGWRLAARTSFLAWNPSRRRGPRASMRILRRPSHTDAKRASGSKPHSATYPPDSQTAITTKSLRPRPPRSDAASTLHSRLLGTGPDSCTAQRRPGISPSLPIRRIPPSTSRSPRLHLATPLAKLKLPSPGVLSWSTIFPERTRSRDDVRSPQGPGPRSSLARRPARSPGPLMGGAASFFA